MQFIPKGYNRKDDDSIDLRNATPKEKEKIRQVFNNVA